MFGAGKLTTFAAVIVLGDIGHVLSSGAVFLALGGLVAFGAVQALARAWKGERDAAVSKADRLEETVTENKRLIDGLTAQLDQLKLQTNVKVYAEQSAREHKAIVDGLNDLSNSVRTNTTALEFLAKQIHLNIDLGGGAT